MRGFTLEVVEDLVEEAPVESLLSEECVESMLLDDEALLLKRLDVERIDFVVGEEL